MTSSGIQELNSGAHAIYDAPEMVKKELAVMMYIEKTYALVLGAVLTLIGILGFIPAVAPNGYLFGIFAIDAVHNIVHLISGIVGLAAGLSPSLRYARWYALAFGIVYALITIIGFVQRTTVLGLFRVNGADNVLHLVIAVSALAVYVISENRERQATRAAAM